MSLTLSRAIREDRLSEFIDKEKSLMPTPKDVDQSERFEQTARELGVELDEDQLRRTLGKLATVKEGGKEDEQPSKK